jgi:aminoglycoside phosphotransferase (APT) family kinase protein
MEKVEHILQKHFPKANWTVTKPQDGLQKKCYIAQSEELKVFIKFDVPIALLRRLGQIGVAPQVIGSGSIGEESYAVQKYLSGIYPDWQWLANHLSLLAQLMRRYHTDWQLTALVAAKTVASYKDHLQMDLEQLEQRLHSLDGGLLHTPEITLAFHTLQAQARTLQPTELVPVHADPNTRNMLVAGEALYLIDWDEIALSDPLRDIGPILWWYIPPQKWPEFFTAYGLELDESLREKIHWWSARISFAVALWCAERNYDCQSFVQDFLAAVTRGDNPHAAFQ